MSMTAVFVTVNDDLVREIECGSLDKYQLGEYLYSQGFSKETCNEGDSFEVQMYHFEIGEGEAGADILNYSEEEEQSLLNEFEKKGPDLEIFQGEYMELINSESFFVGYKDLLEE